MSETGLKFGVLSTATIAIKVANAIKLSDKGEVVAVASRTQEKADAFAKENGIGKAFASYDDLLDDEELDVVYIPLPTALKKEWALKAIGKGKHVLVEKPFACAEDVEEMIAAAKENNVQFMDGTMFVHNVRPEGIKKTIEEKLGGIVGFASGWTLGFGEEIRYNPEMEPMGCIGDLGWYNCRALLEFNGWDLPTKVHAFGNSLSGVPHDCSVIMEFEDGKRFTFETGYIGTWRQWFEINCEKGQVMMDGFVLPYQTDAVIFPDNEYSTTQEFHLITGAGDRETVKLGECVQEVQMVNDFVDAAISGSPNEEWGQQSLKTQMLLDSVFAAFTDGE